MKTASALALVAIGAILAFAVNAQPPFFSFHVAGWVLMLTGIAGGLVPRRGYGWMRRKLVLNSGRGRQQQVDLRQQRFSRLLVPGGLITQSSIERKGTETGRDTAVQAPVESDVIEQYMEE
ncbi:MAG TPA: hypothetical protein VGI58_02340 [Streptosporangiaceae bacterium]|jgi:hypothetical protein